jgi:hypothetical protein
VLAVLGAVFLYWIGIDALEERNELQFFSDSSTYHKAARGELAYLQGTGDAVSVAANYLGPIMLIRLTGDNYYAVLLLNLVLFYFAVVQISRSLGFNSYHYALLLLANPLTISSVLSVNKEIISLVFIAFFLRAYTSRSALAMIGAGAISVLVRWQLTLILPLVWMATTRLNPLRRNRLVVLLVLLLGLSVIYMQLSSVFGSIRENFWAAAAEYEGSGLYEYLVSLQDRGLYWAVFPLKAAHLLFGTGVRFDRLLNPGNVYNDTWHLLHSTALLCVFVALCFRNRFRVRNDLIYLSIIYIALFAVTPIYSPRYFYPVYVLWAAALLAQRDVRFLPGRSPPQTLARVMSPAPAPQTQGDLLR